MSKRKAKGKENGEKSTSAFKTCFPTKLHYILGEMENDGLTHIMSWQSNGCSFKIHNQQLLEKEILSKWFCQSQFSSFQRQLNIYGFTRISSGLDKGGYYHSMFLKGRPELAAHIPRVKIKGKSKRNALATAAAGMDDPSRNNHGPDALPLVPCSAPVTTNPSTVMSNNNESSSSSMRAAIPPADTSAGIGLLCSLGLSANSSLSSLSANLRSQELLSLSSRSLPSSSQLPPVLPNRSAAENTALLQLLLRPETTAGLSITSLAAAHYHGMLNGNHPGWQQPRQPDADDRV